MAGEERIDLPDDLDAVLRKTMAMEPSSAFLPRVRRRLEAEQMRSGRWSWHMLMPVGALGMAGALVLSFSGVTGPVSTPPAPPAPQRLVVQTMAPIRAAGYPVHAPTPDLRSRPLRPAASLRSVPVENDPPVIVDQRQRAALSTVLRMVQQGRLTEEAFAKTAAPSLQPIRDGVVPIGVNALQVSPIESGGVLQFGTEK